MSNLVDPVPPPENICHVPSRFITENEPVVIVLRAVPCDVYVSLNGL